MEAVIHKLVGSRSFPRLLQNQKYPLPETQSNYGNVYESSTLVREMVERNKIIFFGEIHSQPPIITFQRELLQSMSQQQRQQKQQSKKPSSSRLHVIFEHFSFPMQDILNEYQNTLRLRQYERAKKEVYDSAFATLLEKYQAIGTEGHDLVPYRSLLEDAGSNSCVQLHAGFLPRPYAKMLLQKGGMDSVVQELQEKTKWLPTNDIAKLLQSSNLHYNIFESLITGRTLYDQTTVPSDQFQRIFPAQVLKDIAMAHCIANIARNERIENQESQILVLVGNGHLLHYCGVPELLLGFHPELARETCVIASQPSHNPNDLADETNLFKFLNQIYPEGSNPADYVYFYCPELHEDAPDG